MAKTKSRPRKFRPKRFTRRKRSSTMGKIMTPLDVRSSKHLKEFEKRIRKGPITIMLIYADWCGHCHTMMPHFDAASKSPNRSIQSVKVNEQMLDSVNNYINRNVNSSAKPISVEGYPSIILVNNKGEKVTDVETVRDTNAMTKVMNESGKAANNSGLTNANLGLKENNNTRMKPEDMLIKNEDLETGSNANKNKNVNKNKNATKNKPASNDFDLEESVAPSPINTFTLPKNTNKEPNMNTPKSLEKVENEAEKMVSIRGPIEPPTSNSDLISNDLSASEKMSGGGGKYGGSLFSTISQATYTLAAPAALLATAAYVVKGKKSRKQKRKHSYRKRKTVRRQRK